MSFPIIVVIILCAFIILIVLELDRIERGINGTRRQDSWEKGKSGEYLVYKVLQNYEKDGAKFLFNCYLPKNVTIQHPQNLSLIFCEKQRTFKIYFCVYNQLKVDNYIS
jgi:hypothetical protein